MYDFDFDIESETQKLDARIKKLQEEKSKLDERLQTEKQRIELARKVGLLVVSEFEGKPFEYSTLERMLDEHLLTNYDREFFGLKALPEDDPRKPKKRGRKKKEA